MSAVLAPSILSADFARLGDEVRAAEAGGAALVHVDAMDGRFVPNLTLGPPIVKSLRATTDLPLDCHLMIVEPANYVDAFRDAGADMITVHVEADPHLHRTIQRIKERGAKAGVAINPGTPLSALDAILPDVDLVCLMSVNPGFGGQRMIPAALDRARALRRRIQQDSLDVRLELDGGVTADNVSDVVDAGIDIVIAGSAVFDGVDPAAAARNLTRRMAEQAERGIAG